MNVIISPHLDDAVLSLGQFLAAEPARVVTVFAGIPLPSVSTDYDKSCGFSSSRQAVTTRRDEDASACHTVGAEPTHLDFLDLQYRDDTPDPKLIARALHEQRGDDTVYVPVGIGHPDHRLVSDAALLMSGTLVFYEELPYRVLHPEQVVERLEIVRRSFDLQDVPLPLPAGPRAVKEEAIGEYRSQFPDGATDPCLLVPERAWMAARCV